MTTSSVTTTSVTVMWIQPLDSVPVDSYSIVLTRVIGSEQTLCPDVADSKSTQITQQNIFTMQFTALQEYSLYEVNITANFRTFKADSQPGTAIFTTVSAGMDLANYMQETGP